MRIPLLFLALLWAAAANAAEERPIPWPTVAQTMQELIETQNVQLQIQGEWTVATQEVDGQPVIWSFTPQSHYAYPAVAKREIKKDDEGWYVDTAILCEAEKQACDQLQKDFETLDRQMTNSIQAGKQQ